MKIQCPGCAARYRIDTAHVAKSVARVKCPQCGQVFEVQLPAAEGPEPQPAEVGGAVDVLVVDDSKFFRELLVDVLTPLQLKSLLAADGAAALQIIRQRRPTLVILDLNLPGMSGYELIRAVRSDPSLSAVRLLAMSGVYRQEADAVEVKAAGADDFMSKSFKPEQLQFRVKKLLSGGV